MNDTVDDDALLYSYVSSAVGELLVAGDGVSLHRIGFPTGRRVEEKRPRDDWRRDDAAFDETRRQLDAWFGGELRTFDLPLRATGTDFQSRVWHALAEIPYGETCSYGELAERLGEPGASRAVGAANGRNPLPLVLPCHRVIGADGRLTGFGGGMETKRWLLDFEAETAGTGSGQLSLI